MSSSPHLIRALLVTWWLASSLSAADPELIGRWFHKPTQDVQQSEHGTITKHGNPTLAEGPLGEATAVVLNGREDFLEIGPSEPLKLGCDPYTLAMWVRLAETGDDLPGDLLSQFDPATRTGFNLGIYNHWGVTNAQANTRQLHFGIDQGTTPGEFTNHGQLGNAVYVFSLAVHAGRLYATTCHAGATEAGHIFRFEGGDNWTDLGTPDRANAISAMAAYEGQLYVASSKYRLKGSALSESENPQDGGRVFRLNELDQWVDCGRLSEETVAVASLIPFRGQLYASSLYKPAGFFRYLGKDQWEACPIPDGKRPECLTVHDGAIFATCYDEGAVFKFDGEKWEPAGKLPGATQTYGFAVYRGDLYVSEWPNARVYKYRGGTAWEDVGRLGMELETMPLLVYNGQMYGGTLPLAEIYRYDGGMNWARIGRVDETPDVKFRRAWSMAVYQGRLFVGTLPAGHVQSIEIGRNVTVDKEFPNDWQHVTAVRTADRLQLYLNGKLQAESVPMSASAFNIDTAQPLRLGWGTQGHFHGSLSDVRIYRGALSAAAIEQLVKPTP